MKTQLELIQRYVKNNKPDEFIDGNHKIFNLIDGFVLCYSVYVKLNPNNGPQVRIQDSNDETVFYHQCDETKTKLTRRELKYILGFRFFLNKKFKIN